MIVSNDSSGLCVVLQVDHQDQCRAAAEAWGNAAFTRIDPWEPVEAAAGVHDEGWRSWEVLPEVDADGGPVDFPDIDRAQHVALYRAGIAAAFGHGPRVGLLVSLHGEGLYRSRHGLDGRARPVTELPEVAQAFVAEQRAIQAQARVEVGGPGLRSWEWAAYRLLQAWDGLSLYLTWRGLPQGREGLLPAVPRGPDDTGVSLQLRPLDSRTAICEPFPFAGEEVVLPVRARVIADRRYRSNGELRRELVRADDRPREYRVVAG